MKSCRIAFPLLLLAAVFSASFSPCRAADVTKDDAKSGQWIELFDGKSLDGWKASEAVESFTVEDGAIVANGKPRSHLFYIGTGEKLEPFKNFELECDVKAGPMSNGGIYFHTQFQEAGWPKHGFECQVCNTYKDPKKTGSLYGVVNVAESPVNDDEWFKYNIRVEGNRVIIKVNDKVTIDYTEPADKQPGSDFTRKLDAGTFALQAHDAKSKVYFKNLKVKRLP